MIRLNQLKLPVNHTEEQLVHKTAQSLRIPTEDILELEVVRQSLDARKKPELFYSYSIDVIVKKKRKYTRMPVADSVRQMFCKRRKGNIIPCRRHTAAKASNGDRRMRTGWIILRILSRTTRISSRDFRAGRGCGHETGGCGAVLGDRETAA